MIILGARDRCFEQCYDVQRSNVCCIISTPFDMSPETQGPDTFTWNVALKTRCCFHRASRWAMIFSVHAHALPTSFLEKKKTPKTCQHRTPLNLAGASIVSWCFLQIAGGGPNSNDGVPVFVCTLKGGNKKRYIVRTGSQCLFVLCCCCCCCLFICLFVWLVGWWTNRESETYRESETKNQKLKAANQKLKPANQKPKSRESETKKPANQKLKCANQKQNSANQKLRIRT